MSSLVTFCHEVGCQKFQMVSNFFFTFSLLPDTLGGLPFSNCLKILSTYTTLFASWLFSLSLSRVIINISDLGWHWHTHPHCGFQLSLYWSLLLSAYVPSASCQEPNWDTALLSNVTCDLESQNPFHTMHRMMSITVNCCSLFEIDIGPSRSGLCLQLYFFPWSLLSIQAEAIM